MHIDIDPTLVEQYIMELATYGAWGNTGVWRTAYSPDWVGATQQYTSWCEKAGLKVRHDAVGNVWGLLIGQTESKSIVSGSHIDTQKPGGRYDGALGALAALIRVESFERAIRKP